MQATRSLRKLAYESLYRPGIDLSVIVAIISSFGVLGSLFFPWLVGINSIYVPGKGLTYVIAVVLSAFSLFEANTYLLLLLVPPILTGILVYISVKPEGIVPPRVSYKAKSRILLLLAALLSLLPTLAFLNTFALGIYFSPKPGIFVSRWELGGGATVPLYAGLAFILALGLKIIKD